MNKKAIITEYDVIVVGGGASGLMAAISAARCGSSVMVLDHHAVSGKKILSTGNGKCNFTNEKQGRSCYRCTDPAFVSAAMEQFSWKDAVSFFRDLGVMSKTRNGYYYPRSGQASTIRDALISETKRLHIRIFNGVQILNITKADTGFLIHTKMDQFHAESLILATGGQAAPKTGSDGSGYLLAHKLGHSVKDPLPALVPLLSNERWLRSTAGVRCDAKVTLFIDRQEIASDSGELQLTESGISGIPVFQISRYASIALSEKRRVQVYIDFMPELNETALRKLLLEIMETQGNVKNWYQIMSGLLNQKLAGMICSKLKLMDMPVHQLSEHTFQKQIEQVVRQMKQTTVAINGTKRYDSAQVTCGGIPLDEIGSDMQSNVTPGLFFAGEMMDVDGICGGYNLQWAWTSGFIAGKNASELSRTSRMKKI